MIKWTSHKKKIAELKHLDKNPRTITAEAFSKLKERISKRGFHDVLKIDTDGTVLSGNQRLNALTEISFEDAMSIIRNGEKNEFEKFIEAEEEEFTDKCVVGKCKPGFHVCGKK